MDKRVKCCQIIYIREYTCISEIFYISEMDGYLAQLAFTCSNLTRETLGQGLKGRHWRRSGVFIVNFEHVSHIFLVFLLLTLNR